MTPQPNQQLWSFPTEGVTQKGDEMFSLGTVQFVPLKDEGYGFPVTDFISIRRPVPTPQTGWRAVKKADGTEDWPTEVDSDSFGQVKWCWLELDRTETICCHWSDRESIPQQQQLHWHLLPKNPVLVAEPPEDKERERFEAFAAANKNFGERDLIRYGDKAYRWHTVQSAWLAWQARGKEAV